MIEQMIPSIDFENTFISISLNVLDIEPEKETDIDKLEEFNTDI